MPYIVLDTVTGAMDGYYSDEFKDMAEESASIWRASLQRDSVIVVSVDGSQPNVPMTRILSDVHKDVDRKYTTEIGYRN